MTHAAFIRVDAHMPAACRRQPGRLARVVDGDLRADRRVDLGDAWDGLHFLLSPRRRAGAARDTGDPFGLALFGGDPLNAYVLDRDKARVTTLDPAAVARIDRELQKVTGGRLQRQYAPEAMDRLDVFPGDWTGRGDAGFEYLLDAFLQWRELYHRAAEEGQAVICLLRRAPADSAGKKRTLGRMPLS